MKPYAELLEYNQPSSFRKPGFTRIRDQFEGLAHDLDSDAWLDGPRHRYDPERIVEFAGRWDYGENNASRLGEMVTKKNPDNNDMLHTVPIIQKYIDMGHESMLEMADATFFIECSRVVSHELVRHRIASFQQESQRFVKYDSEDPDDLFFYPPEIEDFENIWEEHGNEDPADNYDGMPGRDALIGVYDSALSTYKELRSKGVPPQIARYVFPNATRTRLVMKTNLREWRHICKLRLDKSAQPEMQELMAQIYDQLVDVFPNVMYNALGGERGVR